MKKLLVLVAGIFIVVGCVQKDTTSGPYIAKVNNSAITEDDFMKEISRVPEWARKNFSGNEGKDHFLQELINKELIYQDAISRGLQNDREFMETMEEFKKVNLLSMVLRQEVEEKAQVQDDEIRAFYDNNMEDFRTGTEVRARHILVDTEEKAKDILDSVMKGESFDELARTFSEDKGSAQNGGDLGYFSRGRMVPEFEEAAFSLKKGEVSRPVKTTYGYHIIKVTDRREGSQISFEDARDRIAKQIMNEKQKSLFDAYIETLRKKSQIQTDEEILAGMKMPWEITETENQSTESPAADK